MFLLIQRFLKIFSNSYFPYKWVAETVIASKKTIPSVLRRKNKYICFHIERRNYDSSRDKR